MFPSSPDGRLFLLFTIVSPGLYLLLVTGSYYYLVL